jgi:cytochrome c peroxidase
VRTPALMKRTVGRCLVGGVLLSLAGAAFAAESYVLQAGHASLGAWRLPERPPSPEDNKWTEQKAELGKKLFFDPRLSGTGQVTCVSCHLPERGWEDGFRLSMRFGGDPMSISSPTLVNVGYYTILMWDGRTPSLEKQAFDGISRTGSINAMSLVGPEVTIPRLNGIKGYRTAFEQVFPGEGLTRETVAKAIAAFERTIISNDSPFDRWVRGDQKAMSEEQVRGFGVFVGKGNCASCHAAPNFTDNGFHNIGLKSFADPKHHPGRFKHRPVKLMDGAFRTPTLKDIALRAPHFHDGSASTLLDVVEHYDRGGEVKANLSPNMRPLQLSRQEKDDLVQFLQALTSPQKPYVYPVLPAD